MKDIKNAKLFLFDLDGTIYHDGELIGDAKITLELIRKKGGQIVYLTNNSSSTKDGYIDKLSSIGILDKKDIIYSSLDCAVDFYNQNRKGKKVYALATSKVKDFLIKSGVILVDEENAEQADIVLLTFDKELNYQKIVKANKLLVMGKEYISTHPDFVCPTKEISIPDAGSFIEMFKASSGRTPDLILGKPYPYMSNFLVEGLKVSREQTVMLGDRLYTDIAFGVNANLITALVLSGETTLEQYNASGVKADLVLKDINELQKLI